MSDTDTLIALAREGQIAVVPVEATEEMIEHSARAIHDTEDMCDTVWPDHENDDGYRGDRAYVRICQWPDLYRNAARYAYPAVIAVSPTLTPALLALAEERDRLREALAYAHMGLDRIHTALLSTGPKQAAGEMVAYFRDEAARALTGDTT